MKWKRIFLLRGLIKNAADPFEAHFGDWSK